MDTECPICLSEINNTVTTTGCCKKPFHTECYLKCIQQKNECPLCRSKEFVIDIPPPQNTLVVVQQTDREKLYRVLSCVSSFVITMLVFQYVLNKAN